MWSAGSREREGRGRDSEDRVAAERPAGKRPRLRGQEEERVAAVRLGPRPAIGEEVGMAVENGAASGTPAATAWNDPRSVTLPRAMPPVAVKKATVLPSGKTRPM